MAVEGSLGARPESCSAPGVGVWSQSSINASSSSTKGSASLEATAPASTASGGWGDQACMRRTGEPCDEPERSSDTTGASSMSASGPTAAASTASRGLEQGGYSPSPCRRATPDARTTARGRARDHAHTHTAPSCKPGVSLGNSAQGRGRYFNLSPHGGFPALEPSAERSQHRAGVVAEPLVLGQEMGAFAKGLKQLDCSDTTR